MNSQNADSASLDLTISRRIDAPRRLLWKAWTTPEHIEQWFCPKPWRAEVRAFNLRPGGAFETVMFGPDGEREENPGAFLEIVPEERLVFTSVLAEGWRPIESWLPMTAIIEMQEDGEATLYTARALHKNPDDRQRHLEMGFEEGWGTVIDQLGEFAAGLK